MPGNPYRRSRVLDGGGKEGAGVQQEGSKAKRRSRFLKSDSDEEEAAAAPRRSWRDELGIEKESTRYCCVLLLIEGVSSDKVGERSRFSRSIFSCPMKHTILNVESFNLI